ncbi:MAG: 3-alpha,7-alpha, 12-alpha-trihydroxy-5-beta-cholest-24-enoyl-CoA hydratase [Rhizobacter sp.]|nr:3-alpha,7-alpha, 12-alpha-trihydroxy-5-beta-cholest-24-enoyl-CoA hydratase [Rhizobacter sp.]
MSVDLRALASLRMTARQRLTPRDVMLYALGIGVASDPLDERQLGFVYEDGLRAMPTMAITLCYADLLRAYEEAGLTIMRILHGEQRFRLERPLPVDAELIGETFVTHVLDKGAGKGLLVSYRTLIHDERSAEPVATLDSSSFCLDDGGGGGWDGDGALVVPPPTVRPIPDRPADATVDFRTLPQQALLYRLSGDYNPLHALPRVARGAGYERPILHGRCSFGIAGHALVASCCEYDASRLRGMSLRFSATVLPGETLRTEIWQAEGGAVFQTRVLDRDVVALRNGWADITEKTT